MSKNNQIKINCKIVTIPLPGRNRIGRYRIRVKEKNDQRERIIEGRITRSTSRDHLTTTESELASITIALELSSNYPGKIIVFSTNSDYFNRTIIGAISNNFLRKDGQPLFCNDLWIRISRLDLHRIRFQSAIRKEKSQS